MMPFEILVADIDEIFDKWINGEEPESSDYDLMDSIMNTLRAIRDEKGKPDA